MKDITGVKKDMLTAVSSTGVKTSNGDFILNFICDCGNSRTMSLGNFGSKTRLACKSCASEIKAAMSRKHGFKQSNKVYKAWCKIRERCNNINSKDYPSYGAKGIYLHEHFHNFINFYNEIGDPPTPKHSVDRIDYNASYSPGNIRWATIEQQARNKGKQRNNSSGVTGVVWDNKAHPCGNKSTTYAVAQWREKNIDGKLVCKKKSFSVNKYGLMESFSMACEYRFHTIERLRKDGYEYSENHGK